MSTTTRKSQEVTARQMVNWIAKTLPRFTYNGGDGTVSISAGRGYSTAKSSAPADVLEALHRARVGDIKERARIRRWGWEDRWPHNIDCHGRTISGAES